MVEPIKFTSFSDSLPSCHINHLIEDFLLRRHKAVIELRYGFCYLFFFSLFSFFFPLCSPRLPWFIFFFLLDMKSAARNVLLTLWESCIKPTIRSISNKNNIKGSIKKKTHDKKKEKEIAMCGSVLEHSVKCFALWVFFFFFN